MQSDQEALITGLLFGSDAGFSQDLKEMTRAAGVTHLVAASGANLRFVTALWGIIFSVCGRKFLTFTGMAGITLYWRLAEQSGSLWRASGMWMLGWLAFLWGRKISLWFSLATIVVVTKLFTPEFLTPGFWLSFLAMTGVLFSQDLLSGEKKRALFPQSSFYSNKVALSVIEGTIIFFMVSLWLVPQYGAFEPIGIFSTIVLGTVVEPMVWGGILDKALSFLPEGFLLSLKVPLDFLQSALFFFFMQLLARLAGWGEEIPILWILILPVFFTIRIIVRWKKQLNRKNIWKKIYV